ncbi:peptidase A2 [Rhizobacter sp. Root404]|nr:peptidase A2 [Rhizobacter sp. Root404]
MVALPAFAQKVSLSGSLGDKALLVIDGTPRTVAAGSSVNGVKLLSVSGGDAVVEVQGKRVKLALGGAQVNLGGKPTEGSGSQIVLTAGSGGHFFANGSINGKAVRFVVDTGATYVSMGAAEAERLGIDFRRGERGMTQTANGTMAAYKVMLASVRIGDVQVYNVEALVGQSGMDQILLGNSFLTRFQMKRENDLMTLNRRY